MERGQLEVVFEGGAVYQEVVDEGDGALGRVAVLALTACW